MVKQKISKYYLRPKRQVIETNWLEEVKASNLLPRQWRQDPYSTACDSRHLPQQEQYDFYYKITYKHTHKNIQLRQKISNENYLFGRLIWSNHQSLRLCKRETICFLDGLNGPILPRAAFLKETSSAEQRVSVH